jgi:hypothetical protein
VPALNVVGVKVPLVKYGNFLANYFWSVLLLHG